MSKRKHDPKGHHGGRFVGIPHAVIRSENYKRLSAHAVKYLLELMLDYNGGNNGDFNLAWSRAKALGWKSRDTHGKARRELLHYGLIEETRQGGTNRATLYGVTWKPIDECRGKLDVARTTRASGTWQAPQRDFDPEVDGKKFAKSLARRADKPTRLAGQRTGDANGLSPRVGLMRVNLLRRFARPACTSKDLPRQVAGRVTPARTKKRPNGSAYDPAIERT